MRREQRKFNSQKTIQKIPAPWKLSAEEVCKNCAKWWGENKENATHIRQSKNLNLCVLKFTCQRSLQSSRMMRREQRKCNSHKTIQKSKSLCLKIYLPKESAKFPNDEARTKKMQLTEGNPKISASWKLPAKVVCNTNSCARMMRREQKNCNSQKTIQKPLRLGSYCYRNLQQWGLTLYTVSCFSEDAATCVYSPNRTLF